MDISVVLAQILGIFLVVVGVSMVVAKKSTKAAIEEAIQNRGYLWTWGFLAVLVGAVIVVLNNVWTTGLPLVITIMGWLALVKGAFILFLPDKTIALYRKFNKEGLLVLCGLVAVILGLVLFYL